MPVRQPAVHPHPDQIDSVEIDHTVIQHVDTKLGKPGELGFITSDIAFMIAGDKIDVLLDKTQRTDIFERKITAVEQVPTDEQRIKFFSLQLFTDFLQVRWHGLTQHAHH